MERRKRIGKDIFELFPYYASRLTKKEAQHEATRLRNKGYTIRVMVTETKKGKSLYGTWLKINK